jgi:hypothetical protein
VPLELLHGSEVLLGSGASGLHDFVLRVHEGPSGRAQSNIDGEFWTTKNKDLKLVYLLGFMDGRNEGANEAAGALGTPILNPRLAKLASNITAGQVLDGLDDFYKDYRNARILVRDAIEYVFMEAGGQDGSKLLILLRQQAAKP